MNREKGGTTYGAVARRGHLSSVGAAGGIGSASKSANSGMA